MDKKKTSRVQNTDDLKGFEEFIEHNSDEPGVGIDKSSKNVGGENFTFLINDSMRLKKIAELVADKVPILKKHNQGPKINQHQRNLNSQFKNELFKLLTQDKSPLHKSLTHMWDSFFQKP